MKKLSPLSVSVVVPNWNGAHLLEKNLPAVIAAASQAEIIVTDDASTDSSVSLLADKFPNVIVVTSDTQHGFAGNVNRGVARARGDIVVLLNTDVRPQKNFLAPLLSHFADTDVFAVGCLEKSYEPAGVVERGRGIARWEKGYFIHKKGEVLAGDTAWVAGGSGAFRKYMWQQLGGMDSMFNPFYWEDIDISYRAKKAGWKVLFEPKSVVGHFHEEGKIKTSYSQSAIKRIVYRNQYIFIWKNISDISLIIAHGIWTPVRLLQALLRGDHLMIAGYMWALCTLPAIFKSRQHARALWRKNDTYLFS